MNRPFIVDSSWYDWYSRYFRLFRERAPTRMVELGNCSEGLPTGVASSLESLVHFANLVRDPNATVLDAGAGASSWVLRRMFKNVISTDPDPAYLAVVKDICVRCGELSGDNFIAGLENVPVCDYTYYDYGNAERVPCLRLALASTRVLAYVDDADTRSEAAAHRQWVYRVANEDGHDIVDCPEAIDGFGRWGVVITKKR